jgi:hypothetical protein
MAQHVAAATKHQQPRSIALGTRFLSDELRRQIVIELVDADGALSPFSRRWGDFL